MKANCDVLNLLYSCSVPSTITVVVKRTLDVRNYNTALPELIKCGIRTQMLTLAW